MADQEQLEFVNTFRDWEDLRTRYNTLKGDIAYLRAAIGFTEPRYGGKVLKCFDHLDDDARRRALLHRFGKVVDTSLDLRWDIMAGARLTPDHDEITRINDSLYKSDIDISEAVKAIHDRLMNHFDHLKLEIWIMRAVLIFFVIFLAGVYFGFITM